MGGKRISSPRVREMPFPYSKAIEAGGFIFVAGMIPHRRDVPLGSGIVTDDIREGVRICMEDMQNILEAAGAKLTDLVKVNIHLKNMDDFDAMNEVYRTFFPNDNPPARATVEAARIGGNAVLEIEGIAYKG